MDQDKVKRLAAEASKWFETVIRNGGDKIVCNKAGHPAWVKDMVKEAHGDMFPDDFIYSAVDSALDHIGDIEDLEEPEIESDYYNADLLAWFGSHIERVGRFEEAVQKMGGFPKDNGFFTVCMSAQQREKEEIYYAVCRFLDEMDED